MDQAARSEIAMAFDSIALEAGRAIMAIRGSSTGGVAELGSRPCGIVEDLI